MISSFFTIFEVQPLTVDHGAPLRLLVPVKLGLKNVKAITKIKYSLKEPRDYWAERRYSRYDGNIQGRHMNTRLKQETVTREDARPISAEQRVKEQSF